MRAGKRRRVLTTGLSRAVAETAADAAYAQLDAALAALEKGQARPSGVVK